MLIQAIEVIVERSPSSLLERLRSFTRYPSGRSWIFKGDMESTVRIRFLHPGEEAWSVPEPGKITCHTIHPRDLANRNLNTHGESTINSPSTAFQCTSADLIPVCIVTIAHPTVLLTMKLSIWEDARDANSTLGRLKADIHFEDIMAILQWHQDRRIIIDRTKFSEVTHNTRRRLCKLCKETHSARNSVCACLSFDDFRDVISFSIHVDFENGTIKKLM